MHSWWCWLWSGCDRDRNHWHRNCHRPWQWCSNHSGTAVDRFHSRTRSRRPRHRTHPNRARMPRSLRPLRRQLHLHRHFRCRHRRFQLPCHHRLRRWLPRHRRRPLRRLVLPHSLRFRRSSRYRRHLRLRSQHPRHRRPRLQRLRPRFRPRWLTRLGPWPHSERHRRCHAWPGRGSLGRRPSDSLRK
jgi:hypothetical protein